MSTAEFAATFRKFMEQALTTDPGEDPYFVARLRDHFGADTASLPIVSEMFEPADHPNVQIALDAFLPRGNRSLRMSGGKQLQQAPLGPGPG